MILGRRKHPLDQQGRRETAVEIFDGGASLVGRLRTLGRRFDPRVNELGGKISLQAVAGELGLSVSHFSRAFRISTGLPPHQWLLHQRVRAAQQLMSVHERSLSDIAISAGFANQSHFTRVFSAIVGASPRV